MLHFLGAVRALPHVRFCLMNVDRLAVSVRSKLVAAALGSAEDPPLASTIDNGLVLAFRSHIGLDAFSSVLEDITPEDVSGSEAVQTAFAQRGLKQAIAGLTLVAGRAGAVMFCNFHTPPPTPCTSPPNQRPLLPLPVLQ